MKTVVNIAMILFGAYVLSGAFFILATVYVGAGVAQ
tara:strand:- start:362 stop:469 length:108 start_codon:yes stop_codon:yes gene_type:complete